MLSGIAGKTALVTGAGRGMGAAVAHRLAAEGANLVLVDRDEEALSEVAATLGDGVVAVGADLSTERGAQAGIDAAVEQFGRLDLVHNHAGIAGPAKLLADFSPEEFDLVMATNTRSCFLVLRAALRQLRGQGEDGGSIVNTSSQAGLRGLRCRGVYAASKHAIVGLTKVAAIEGADYGVRVNAICPGPIETAHVASGPVATWGGGDIEEGRRKMLAPIPLARIGQPGEVAACVAWLLSSESSYISGVAFPVDGGLESSSAIVVERSSP